MVAVVCSLEGFSVPVPRGISAVLLMLLFIYIKWPQTFQQLMEVTRQKFHAPRDAPPNDYGKCRKSWFLDTLADPGSSLFRTNGKLHAFTITRLRTCKAQCTHKAVGFSCKLSLVHL